MANITRSNFAKALWPGINAWYGKAYEEYPVEWTQLGYEIVKSKQAYVEDVGISAFGLAQVKDESDAITYDTAKQAYVTRYVPVTYALGFTISREAYEDNLYAQTGLNKANSLAFSMRQTKEVIGASVYNNGFNSAYAGGDGVELFSAVHPHFAGDTWQNELSTPVDLSEAGLEQAVIDVSKWTDDRGLQIAVVPQKLVVPTDLQFEAERILMNPNRPYTADRDINAIRATGKFPQGYCVNHYLTSTDAWFFWTNTSNGLKMVERRSQEFAIDNDFDTELAKFKATARYVPGFTDPRKVFGVQPA